MVSIANELFPDPDGPQNTVISFRGMRAFTDFRLWRLAPSISMCVISCSLLVTRLSLFGFLPFALPVESDFRLTANDGRRTGFSAAPVNDMSCAAICSGVPVATTVPPPLPPSGPMSMIQSAVFITSRLCSMTSTVFPWSANPCSTSSSFRMSSKCNPVVGSSSMYRVRPVPRRHSSFASFTRWASPPERVGDGWPSLM